MTHNVSLSNLLSQGLQDAIGVVKAGPVLADCNRHMISDLNYRGEAVGRKFGDVLAEATQVLIESGKIYRHGNSVVYELNEGLEGSLATLAVDQCADSHASARLCNVLGAERWDSDSATQSSLPSKFTAALLASHALWQLLPEIALYSRRPVFDQDFGLCGPGYHPSSRILVHGPAVTPELATPEDHGAGNTLDCLPYHLGTLLREFAWKSDADLVNAVAAFLTGVLCNHFVDDPHPIVVIDGNQPSTGKTLLAQCLGIVLDGVDPPRLPLTGDEELEKKLGAHMLASSSSLIFLDNVRARLESGVLEQNALSPILRFRILGSSSFVERPNTYLWILTSNLTTACSDIMTRGLPIRLRVEGDPRQRNFSGRPHKYAKEHRLTILEELAAMVHQWLQAGKPPGAHSHRCDYWSSTIGGILGVAGLGESFLANFDEAAEEMHEGLNQLSALADYIYLNKVQGLMAPTARPNVSGTETTSAALPGVAPSGAIKSADNQGLRPTDWVRLFDGARLMQDKLLSASARGKTTVVGQFLATMIDRSVAVESDQGDLTFTLRRRTGRSNTTFYFFEISERDSAPISSVESAGGENQPEAAAGRLVDSSIELTSELESGLEIAEQADPPDDIAQTEPGLDWV